MAYHLADPNLPLNPFNNTFLAPIVVHNTDIRGLASNDWITFHGPIKDGDYVSLRTSAFTGTTIKHSTLGVNGEVRSSNLQANNFANPYTWTIRRIELDLVLKCWVVPILSTTISQRPDIMKNDYFILISSGSGDMVMGTDTPPPIGNNGDYKVKLKLFPAVTQNQVNNTGITENIHRFVSAGMWNNESKKVDFVAQSTCVWSFNGASLDSVSGLSYGKALNIRNVWTEVKSQEAHILDHGSPLALTIQRTFNGGRNLTIARGSGGETIKLALSNSNTDDKSIWFIDSWNGHQYPVQRVIRPVEPQPPYTPETNPIVTPPLVQPVAPDLTQMIENPQPPPRGVTLDAATGLPIHTALQNRNNDLRTFWEKLLYDWFGIVWADVSYIQLAVVFGIVVIAVPTVVFLIKEFT